MQVTELGSLNNNSYRTFRFFLYCELSDDINVNRWKRGNEHPIMAIDNEALSVRQVERIQIKLSDKKYQNVKGKREFILA